MDIEKISGKILVPRKPLEVSSDYSSKVNTIQDNENPVKPEENTIRNNFQTVMSEGTKGLNIDTMA
jgi:hypothetical protein